MIVAAAALWGLVCFFVGFCVRGSRQRARDRRTQRAQAKYYKLNGAFDVAKAFHCEDPTHSLVYSLWWSEEDGQFVGGCANFPSLSHLADTPVDALRGIVALAEDEAVNA